MFIRLQILGLRMSLWILSLVFIGIPILGPIVVYIFLATILHLPLVISVVVGMLYATLGYRWFGFVLDSQYIGFLQERILQPVADVLDDIENDFEKTPMDLK